MLIFLLDIEEYKSVKFQTGREFEACVLLNLLYIYNINVYYTILYNDNYDRRIT